MSPKAKSALEARGKADKAYKGDTKAAAEEYGRVVSLYRDVKDPEVQDVVASARIKLGYLASRSGDMDKAREIFKEAEESYAGSGAMSADFGGLKDQAAYQAAACLMGDGKNAEAEKELKKFIKEYPLSPLVHGASKRLAKLNGGAPDAETEGLLQSAVTKQEKHIRFETSVCGPKLIEYLLPLLGKKSVGYKDLAKRCRTTDQGTTIEGMRDGLKSIGIESFGYAVSRGDLAQIPLPAIWLQDDHYVGLLEVTDKRARVYDPRMRSEQFVELPALDEPTFTASIISFSLFNPAGDRSK
jgi:tetratricopeptide (TPR) repeat protein